MLVVPATGILLRFFCYLCCILLRGGEIVKERYGGMRAGSTTGESFTQLQVTTAGGRAIGRESGLAFVFLPLRAILGRLTAAGPGSASRLRCALLATSHDRGWKACGGRDRRQNGDTLLPGEAEAFLAPT